VNSEYIEPVKFDEVVYENDSILIKKICFWEGCRLWKDGETELSKVLLPGSEMFSLGQMGTYALPDGTRATEKDFYYIGSFHDGITNVIPEDIRQKQNFGA